MNKHNMLVYVSLDPLIMLWLTTGNNEKVDSLYATPIKCIGQKQLLYQSPIMLKNLRFL